MFDFREMSKKHTDKIIKDYNIDIDPIYSPKFRKLIKWIGYTFTPMMMNFASFLIFIKIMFAIKDRLGIEGVVVIGMIMIIFTLRQIVFKLDKSNS